MQYLNFIMPGVVLLLSFTLKMFIDRSTSGPDAIVSTLELPVDIIFLSISLITGYTLSQGGNPILGFAWFSIYIIGAIIIVVLWRRSIQYFDTNRFILILLIATLNYALSITALVHSIGIISGSYDAA